MKRNAWVRVGVSACQLSLEASTETALRMMKLAAGGKAAQTEAHLMVSEKIKAN
jgi:hypothetical protein